MSAAAAVGGCLLYFDARTGRNDIEREGIEFFAELGMRPGRHM
eukprot:SAG11_NODE_3598_length_2347_cov_2.962189_1_plen_42_part_10